MVHFAEPDYYTLQGLVGMSLNITYHRSIIEESKQDTIEITCCSEGSKHWEYALKVVSSIAKKSYYSPHVYFDWGGSSKCVIRVKGSWNAESMSNFLRKASSERAIESGLFNGPRILVFNHSIDDWQYISEEDFNSSIHTLREMMSAE